jgi:hypothetical protein
LTKRKQEGSAQQHKKQNREMLFHHVAKVSKIKSRSFGNSRIFACC